MKNRKTRVLVFSHNFPPAIDGGSRLLSLVTLERKRRGNEVRVLTSDAHSSDEYLQPKKKRLPLEWSRWRGIPVFRLKTWRWPAGLIRRLVGPVFISFPFWLFSWRPKEIIAGVFPTLVPLYAWFWARITGAKLILVPCFHQEEPGFYRKYLLWVLKRADEIWALTNIEKSFYQKKFGIPARKILVFRPKIDPGLLLGQTEEAKFSLPATIVFIGSQSAHKRIEWLIEAFRKLKLKLKLKEVESKSLSKSRKELGSKKLEFKLKEVGSRKFKLKLIIVGSKTLFSPEIEAKLKQLPKEIRKEIEVLGRVSEKRKIEILDQAWVLVNPSIHESLGLVFFEAWARKKPVIAAKIPVLEEVIADGRDGLLFQKDSLEDLVRKIEMIITDKSLARRLGEAGYKKLIVNK